MRIASCLLVFFVLFGALPADVSAATPSMPGQPRIEFPKPLDEYHDDQAPNLFEKLLNRAKVEPFNVIATLIFLCAIVHTFLTSKFMHISHAFRHEFQALESLKSKTGNDQGNAARQDRLQFRAQLFHFMGEVETVFGIWLIPLGLAIILMKGNREAEADPPANHDCASPISRLDSFYFSLSAPRCAWFPVFSGVHGSNQPAPEQHAFARAAACRFFPWISRYPWWMPAMVDSASPWWALRVAASDWRRFIDRL
jgi:hypothetical protein